MTLNQAINYLNTLYEGDTSAPTSGDEDYTYWTNLLNIAINIWENEEGMMWRELFVNLQDNTGTGAGDQITVADQTSYDLPSDFNLPASGYVWLGSGSSKTAVKVIPIEEKQLYENTSDYVCWFSGITLEFNPNMTIIGGYDINYSYYKFASTLVNGTDTFEMSDPMFAVYYALSELKKDEGDTSASVIATQKLEAMKTRNVMPTWLQDNFINFDTGFGG